MLWHQYDRIRTEIVSEGRHRSHYMPFSQLEPRKWVKGITSKIDSYCGLGKTDNCDIFLPEHVSTNGLPGEWQWLVSTSVFLSQVRGCPFLLLNRSVRTGTWGRIVSRHDDCHTKSKLRGIINIDPAATMSIIALDLLPRDKTPRAR